MGVCSSANTNYKILYHATSEDAWIKISKEKTLKPGRDGMLGAGIYFAETPEAALFKATKKEVVLIAKVNVGKPYVVRDKSRKFTAKDIKRYKCNSVNSQVQGKDPEWMVFDPKRVKEIKFLKKTDLGRYNQDSCTGGDNLDPLFIQLVMTLDFINTMLNALSQINDEE